MLPSEIIAMVLIALASSLLTVFSGMLAYRAIKDGDSGFALVVFGIWLVWALISVGSYLESIGM